MEMMALLFSSADIAKLSSLVGVFTILLFFFLIITKRIPAINKLNKYYDSRPLPCWEGVNDSGKNPSEGEGR